MSDTVRDRLERILDRGPWRFMGASACWISAIESLIRSDPTPSPTAMDWLNLSFFFIWIGFGIKILWKGIR